MTLEPTLIELLESNLPEFGSSGPSGDWPSFRVFSMMFYERKYKETFEHIIDPYVGDGRRVYARVA